MEKSNEREELSLVEMSKIAEGFKGLYSLIISGGEPFLREDLLQIIKEFHDKAGVRHVSIPTNLLCADAPEKIQEICQKLPDAFFRVLISINGVGPDQDKIRGHEGGFDKTMKNLERLKGYQKELNNLSLNAATVLSAFNADKILSVLDFCGSLGLDDMKLIYVRGDTREKKAKEVSLETYQKAIKRAEELTRGGERTKSFYNDLFSSVSLVAKEEIGRMLAGGKMTTSCTAGSTFLVISETGEVFPCETLGKRLGDLREHSYDLKSLMATDEAKEVLRYIKGGNCHCTMDCTTISNVIYSPSLYPRVLKKLLGFYSKSGQPPATQ